MRAIRPVSIGGIEFDALIEESLTLEAQVPEYPTEEGFSVSDNITLKPEILSMTLYVTDTPVTWRNRRGHRSGHGRTESVVRRLKNLYFSRRLVSVSTSGATYRSMAITNLSISKSKEVGYAREIPITLQKVVVTSSSTVTIPAGYGKSGATGASAGSANTTAANSGSGGGGKEGGSGSILYKDKKNFGLM